MRQTCLFICLFAACGGDDGGTTNGASGGFRPTTPTPPMPPASKDAPTETPGGEAPTGTSGGSAPVTLDAYPFTLDVPTAIDATSDGEITLLDETEAQYTAGSRASRHLRLSVNPGTYKLVSPSTLHVELTPLEADGTETTCGAPTTSCTRTIVPAPNGVPVEVDFGNGCPPGMDRVTDFCIDRFEAMLVTADGESFSPYANPGSTPVKALSVENAIPQGYINRPQAAAACAANNKRLCQSSEWLRACQGGATTTYPYGNTRDPGVCNDARASHPAVQYFGTAAACVWSNLGNACINQLADGLARTGAHPGCVSEDGPRDMMGNVHEWVADDHTNGNGIFRGGFYVDTKINGEGCMYRTTAHAPSHWDYSTGFRCCF